MIKNLFNDLKKIGRKKYCFRNGEEELYFVGENLGIGIYCSFDTFDLSITFDGSTCNYLDSPLLTFNQKERLLAAVRARHFLKKQSKTIVDILLEAFRDKIET